MRVAVGGEGRQRLRRLSAARDERGTGLPLAGQLARLSLRVGLPSHHTAACLAPCSCADDSLRITRGDGGSVFVLVKDSYTDTG